MNSFIKIDNEGLVIGANDQAILDPETLSAFFSSVYIDANHTYRGEMDGEKVIVEPYHFILKATHINQVQDGFLHVDCVNDVTVSLDLSRIYLDSFDRFIIYSTKDLPVVLSGPAQDQLFDLADSFEDDSIVINSVRYMTPPWISADAQLSDSQLWSQRYITHETGWDMGAPSPSLLWAVDKLKLPKMRVAVLGCGLGHDAHFMASKGHMVTGFDFSAEAIQSAEALYPSQTNLKWVCKDVFEMSEEFKNSFDLVLEHTCFCAVDPERRKELVKVWKNILSDEGQVLGIFFVMPKTYGPPYGATEQEIHDLLVKEFRFNLWTRSRASHPKRLGRELIVLTRLKNR